jgi:hypothetical protein
VKTQDGRLYVIAGASRSGKTIWTARQTAKARRVFAWDPEDQWSQQRGYRKVTTRAQLLEAVQKPGPVKVAYVVGGQLAPEFDFFAGCAMYAARYVGPCDVIAEELADVTTPAKAPGNWGILLRRGLKRGATIWAISQRWSEADKTAVGNASDFVVFRQSSGDDSIYLARKLRLKVEEIDALMPLEFIKKDALTGQVDKGKLKF